MNSRKITTFSQKSTIARQFAFASILSFISILSFGQTTLYNQSFEADLSGYNHVPNQTPATDAGDQYFSRAMPSDAAIYEGNVGPYTNVTGDFLFVGSNPNTINGGVPGEITFDQIDISGFNSIMFSADFGAVDNDWDNPDTLKVQYSIDGGAFIDLYFFNAPITNDPLVLEGNAVGGSNTANGTILTYELQTITAAIAGTGSTLDLKIVCDAGANYEAFGVDEIVVTGIMQGGATEVAFASGSADVSEGAGTYDVCVNIVNEDASIATTVEVALTGGTATDGTDITTYATATLTFPAGSSDPQCTTITITDDTEIEDGETLIFALQNAAGGNAAVIGAIGETTITILDNDIIDCGTPAWVVVSPEPAAEWEVDGTGFEANGFCGGGCTQDVETWLIYGPLDMSGTDFLELSFNADEGFGTTDLDVKYSSDAGANACPDEATWTSVGMITEDGDYSFDFGAATATEVFIAIEYNDDGADGYSNWTLDNFVLGADVCPTVGTLVQPVVEAGDDVVFCGIAPVTLAGEGDGMWTGGAGSFDDATSPTAIYTPDESEEGTTVVLTYTLNLAACTGFSDEVSLTFFELPGDTEFSYGETEICPGGDPLMVMHTTGEDGEYTVTMGDAAAIALDPVTGEIDLINTISGEYEITNTIAGAGNIIISGVIDGPLSGGQPKAIEFYTLDAIPDLSIYGFGSANNGNGGGTIEYPFPADAIPANTFFYLADNFTDFSTFFGFEPDYTNGVASINGDDALELFCNGIVIDVFGDINTDGSGEAWEYLDGWAYRMPDLTVNLGDFVVGDFTYSGTNVLDGETSNSTADTPFPLGTFTTTMPGFCPNSSTSVTLQIGDDESPVVDCPQDILVPLEPGDCEDIVTFTIPFFDNCGTVDGEASQLVNDQLVNTALDCTGNTSNHLRIYENTLPVPLQITTVNVGIWNSAIDEVVVVNVYEIETGADFIYANMNLVATTDLMVPAGTAQSIFMAPIEASVPAGGSYVLELRAPNTANFIVGYNNQGETGSSYLAGNLPTPCVSLEPTDIDILNGGAFTDFAVVLYSNAEGGTSITQTAGQESGSYFQIGTTTNTFIVTDVNGNTTECTFDVIVEEFSNTSGTLTCNDNLNISLDSSCELVLGADMLLEGNSYGCYDNYLLSVSGGVTGNIITQPGTYTVTVTDPNTGNNCWSTINVEDKNAPVLDCACPVGGTPIELPFTGTLDENSPIWTRPFVAGGCNPSLTGVDIPYMTHSFAISMDANVTSEVVTFTAPSNDSFLALYEGSFDPTDPCGNLVITNDDGGVGFLSSFSVDLNTGTQYILVVTTFNENGNDYGDYVVEMSSDAEFLELEEACNFRCVDLDYVLNSTDLTAIPGVTSCSPANLVFADEVTTDANGQQIILRTWVATNDNGTSTCVQQFNFAALTIADLTLPTSPLELSCNDGTSPEEIVALLDNPLTKDNPNTAYEENNEGYIHAYPTYLIDGHAQKVDNNVCDIYAAYTDQELDACEEGCNGNRKVIRTWTLVDWNTLETTTYTQTIKAVDSEAPTLNTQDISVSTDAWGCAATFVVPEPWELHDNCDYAPRYYVTGPAGVSITGNFEEGFTASGAPKGVHTFNYVAYDCCGNEASFSFEVTVSDITPPVVISKQNIVVSLTSAATSQDGFAKLYAESVDNGSYDGCSDNVKLEIRRDTDNCDVKGNMTYNADGHPQDGSPNPLASNYDPDGGEYVKFCCTDLMTATVDIDGDGTNDAGYVKVWLRVWDDGDMNGIFGSDGDNYNESWSYVKVEDKLAPQITCPVDVTISCSDDYFDLATTGEAQGYGSCGGVPVEYKDVLVSLNTCNEGFVRRRWNIVGRTDIFCDQTITMEGIDAPVNVSFSAVGDKDFDCLDGISVGEPTWTAGPCDILGYTVATDTFRFEDGACYKLVNTYQVINWCDYDPNSGSTEGMWEHIQVIKVIDNTIPEIENCEDAMYAINDHADEDGDGEVCEAKLVLTNVAMDPGSDNCPTAWLKWEVVIDLWADGTPDYEYTSFIPGSSFNFNQFNTDANGNGIPDAYIKPTASGQEVSIPLVDIAGSMSNHKVKWTVTDGCNNFTSCSNDFMVVDKKAPTPYCIDISSAVMESTGTVELWAIDFNVGSFDNCTAEDDLRYTFTDVAPEDDNNYDPSQRSSSRVFDCDDVMENGIEVNMYVWDEKGNADFCLVYLTLVDNNGACGEGKAIAGQVASESGTGVNEVEIEINSTLPEFPRLAVTDEQGMYAFDNVPQNGTYGVTGVKDVDYLNGVSTLDLVKIQRHILGLESFDSPYKLVAADVNADNDVKVNDLNELRKLILGVITDLPTNESWRFVDAAQVLDMDTDLEDVNYEISISNLSDDVLDNNFVAVKVGDVTENASTSLQANSNIEVRSNKTLDLLIDNREVEAGELVEVAFTSENFTDVYGYQFTMELNGLEFAEVTKGALAMTDANVGVLNNEVVTMSYHSSNATTTSTNENIFAVSFRATAAGQLSNMITVSSKVTASEAYIGETLEIREVVISTRGEVATTASNQLYQNEPNPFKELTTINFELAEAGSVTFRVTDVTGRVLKVINTEGVKGMNIIPLQANDFATSGVLYYTIESGEFTDTKKMIVVR